jgi:6-phosphogluconolactonase (cycloisomerase 2 family)
MNKQKCSTFAKALLITAALSVAGGPAIAADDEGGTPVNETRVKSGNDAQAKSGSYGHTKHELEARKENVRKQHEQRVTPEKRKVAVESLKAERLKVYNAKQAVKQSQPQDLNLK